jgi:hypothetical protein
LILSVTWLAAANSPPPSDLQSVLPRACARVVPGVNILTTFLSNLLNLLKMKMIMIKGAGRALACACVRARPDHQSGVKPLPRSAGPGSGNAQIHSLPSYWDRQFESCFLQVE